jgi:hypothetical protein
MMDVNTDSWKLLAKVTVAPVVDPPKQGFVETTHVLNTPTGCAMKVATAIKDPAGVTVLLTESIAPVPGVQIETVEGVPTLVALA